MKIKILCALLAFSTPTLTYAQDRSFADVRDSFADPETACELTPSASLLIAGTPAENQIPNPPLQAEQTYRQEQLYTREQLYEENNSLLHLLLQHNITNFFLGTYCFLHNEPNNDQIPLLFSSILSSYSLFYYLNNDNKFSSILRSLSIGFCFMYLASTQPYYHGALSQDLSLIAGATYYLLDQKRQTRSLNMITNIMYNQLVTMAMMAQFHAITLPEPDAWMQDYLHKCLSENTSWAANAKNFIFAAPVITLELFGKTTLLTIFQNASIAVLHSAYAFISRNVFSITLDPFETMSGFNLALNYAFRYGHSNCDIVSILCMIPMCYITMKLKPE